MKKKIIVLILLFGAGHFAFPQKKKAQEIPDYKNAKLPIEHRVEDLLRRMTLEEKVAQLQTSLFLRNAAEVPPNGLGCLSEVFNNFTPKEAVEKFNALQRAFVEKTRLGIPILYHGEAVTGLMAFGPTAFPQPLSQAATFNVPLHTRMAEAIAKETYAWGHRQVLSPTINVAYDPRWGRTHETYGEDPYLVSRMGVSYIKPMEAAGIICTPKHFAANTGHNGAFGGAVYFSERFLREVEFPPYKAAVQEAKCNSIMPAYNTINGIPCTSSKWLLTDVLRNEWGFNGFVGSDYGGVTDIFGRHRVAKDKMEAAIQALEAGNDVEMPLPDAYPFLVDAVKQGKIKEETIDRSVRRVLYQKFRVGIFEKPYADPTTVSKICNSPEHRQIAKEVALQGMVLLKNENNVLPFPKDIKSIAVLGPLGDKLLVGNYAPHGTELVSIAKALRNKLGDKVEVMVEKGVELTTLALPTITEEFLYTEENGVRKRGLKAEYFGNMELKGSPAVTRIDPAIDFEWGEGVPHPFLPANGYSARWTGYLVSPAKGKAKLGITVDDGARVYLDDKLVIDEWRPGSPRLVETDFEFEKDRTYKLKVEYYEDGYVATARLGWSLRANSNIPKAVELAKKADVTVVAVGAIDGEGTDRGQLELSTLQEELILSLRETGKPFVVILATGNVIAMNNWADNVPAILEAWYPGQEGGSAIADVLFGDYNPGGKLPITFPRVTGQVPNYYHKGYAGASASFVAVGNTPQFPFGHGLSYTKFEYSNFSLSSSKIKATEAVTATVTIKNTGSRKGDEIVQLYITDEYASVSRPPKLLRGFDRITLEPGESKTVSFKITSEDLGMYDVNMKWVVEPGTFEIMAAASSEDIRQRAKLEVTE